MDNSEVNRNMKLKEIVGAVFESIEKVKWPSR